jgi:hypothetical protein
MDPLTALMIFGTIASIAGQAKSSYDQNKYNKKLEKAEKEQQKRNERAAYKSAMERVLGGNTVTPYQKPIAPIERPSDVWNTIAGVGGALSNLSAAQIARQQYPLPGTAQQLPKQAQLPSGVSVL